MRKTILAHAKRKYTIKKNEVFSSHAWIFFGVLSLSLIINRLYSIFINNFRATNILEVTFYSSLFSCLMVILSTKYFKKVSLIIFFSFLSYILIILHFEMISINSQLHVLPAKLCILISLPLLTLILPFTVYQIIALSISTFGIHSFILINNFSSNNFIYELIILFFSSIISTLNTYLNQKAIKQNILREQSLLIERKILEDHVNQRSQTVEIQAQQIKELALEITQAENRERQNIASRIHDNLQQILAAAKLQIGLLKRHIDKKEQSDSLSEIESLLTDSIEISRSLSMELAPQILFESGQSSAFFWLARWMETHHQLTTKVTVDDSIKIQNDDINSFLFQSARELLFNIVKHAKVKNASLELSKKPNYFAELKIQDQGVGFNASNFHKNPNFLNHFGLANIKRRAKLLGGDFEIQSDVSSGTTVKLTLPTNITRSN